MKRLRILLYDSGIGGLNVLAKLIWRYPSMRFFYMSDSGNFPYGTKTKEELLEIAVGNLDAVNVTAFDAVILACNTLTSSCMNELKEKYKGVFFLGVTPAAVINSDEKTLVFCTSRTKENLLLTSGRNVEIVSADNLVRDIEKNIFNLGNLDFARYTQGLKDDYRKIVLGCTHFCYLKKDFAKAFPSAVVDDGLEAVNRGLKNYSTTFDHQEPLLKNVVQNGNFAKLEQFIFCDKKRNFEIFKNIFYKK
ncbi:MAG: glutamate racemase [Christensenellaceae bacterium]